MLSDPLSGGSAADPVPPSDEASPASPAREEAEPAGDSAPDPSPAAEESAPAAEDKSAAEEAPAAEEPSGAGGEPAAEAESAAPDPAAAELEAARADAAAWKDRYARLQADFDNWRKRQARERQDWIRQANADLLEELLPVLDQTDGAIASVAKDATDATKPYLDGFELVRRTFLAAVAKFGLEPVPTAVGKPLDPATAEALSVMKTGQAEPGCVVVETRRGYTLGGKLLRPAQVVVEQED